MWLVVGMNTHHYVKLSKSGTYCIHIQVTDALLRTH